MIGRLRTSGPSTIAILALFGALAGLALAPRAHAQGENVTLLGHLHEYSSYSNLWGYADTTSGREVAILGTNTGTSFIEVTDPENPVELTFIPGPNSIWREFKTYGHYAYAVTEGGSVGMQIIDMSDVDNIFKVKNFGTWLTAHTVSCEEATGRLYVNGAGVGGMHILNVATDPENPISLGNYNTRYVHDIYVQDNIGYSAEIYDGVVSILNLANPASIVNITTFGTPGDFSHNTWTNADRSILCTTDEIVGSVMGVYDISVPASPVLLDTFTSNSAAIIHNVIIKGNYAYISFYTEGLRIANISDPTNVFQVGAYDTYAGADGGFDGAWGVHPFLPSGNILISDIESGLYVFRFDPPGYVVGTVTDSATAAPLAGAGVTVVGESNAVVSGVAGDYLLAVPVGSQTLRFSLFGYADLDVPIVVVESATDTVDAEMAALPAGGLQGTVSSLARALIPDAEVTVVGSPLLDVTDGSGGYQFASVPAGTWDVMVQVLGYAPETRTIAVTEGGAAVLDFALEPALVAYDMEADQGWDGGQPGDNASTGIWVRGEPQRAGTGEAKSQPGNDHTPVGTDCWVTGNTAGPSNHGENDVDGGKTTLLSPVMDVTTLDEPVVSYWKWYTNHLGSNPNTDPWIVDVSNNGGGSWVNVENTMVASASAWVNVTFAVNDYVSSTNQVVFRFIASDFAPGAVVEACIDDFMIYDGVSALTAAPAGTAPARRHALAQNTPNPFNPSTTITYRLEAEGGVELAIFNTAGELVRTLAAETQAAGGHSAHWDGLDDRGRSVASGAYLYRLKVNGDLVASRKMLLLR